MPHSIAQIWTCSDSSIVAEVALLTTDRLGNIYIATPQNSLQKVSNTGQTIAQYQDTRLGRIGAIDATDPMEVLLFYPDQQTIILLDRTLTPISQISFPTLGISFVRAICRSNTKDIWFFDSSTQQLKQINRKGSTNYISDPMPLLLGLTLQPAQIVQNDNTVAINDTAQGIFLFDIFGNYTGTSTCQTPYIVGITNTDIFAIASTDSLFQVAISQADCTKIPAPTSFSTQQIFLSTDMLYIAKRSKIYKYVKNQ